MPHPGQNVASLGISAPHEMQNFFPEGAPAGAVGTVVAAVDSELAYVNAAERAAKTPNIGDITSDMSQPITGITPIAPTMTAKMKITISHTI